MSAPVQSGEIVKGKYRIDRVLGEGGMGVVVAARHIGLDQRVAIKFLLPEMLAHPEIVERFAREARAASRIESDHVARVTDVDALDDDTPFMVMEYLEGSDLSSVLRGAEGLPVELAVKYLLEACEGIGEAHRLGIIHRDIKPANLFLAHRGNGRTRVKVLDFGISKFSGSDGSTASGITRTGMVIGSADYMSPEQMLSTRDVDARADIWALGVTLYELLTAHVPFPGETLTQVCALVMSSQPRPPSSLRPDVPQGLDAVVLRCLEKKPVHRYASVAALVEALSPYATTDSNVQALAAPTIVPGGVPQTLAFTRSFATQPWSLVARTIGVGASFPLVARLRRMSTRQLAVGAIVAATLCVVGIVTASHFGVTSAPAAASANIASSVPVFASAAPGGASTMTTPFITPGTLASAPSAPAAPLTASSTPSQAPKPISSIPRVFTPPARSSPVVAPVLRNCEPPFTIGVDGNHHMKPECQE
jgi:serine/threonine-protein kinase